MNNPNNISTGKVLKKLLYFVKPHSFWLGVSVAGAVASMALDILMANVLRILTDTAIYGQREGLIRSLYYMAFVIISGIFVSFTNKYSSGRFCLYAAKDIREAASRHMERLTMSYMENNNSGEAVSRLTNNVATVQNFLENNFINIIYMPLVTIGGLTYLFILNWKLLLFSCALIPVAGIFAGILSKPVGKYSKQLQEQLGKINSLVQDAIGGISMLKAFNLNKVLLVKYKENVDASLDIALKIELRNAMMAPAKTVLNIAILYFA